MLLLLIALLQLASIAQSGNIQWVKLNYISPVPGSKYIMPMNNIALRHGEPFDPVSLRSDLISVNNQRGESWPGKLVLSDDQRTIIFLPEKPYPMGEKIHAELQVGLRTISGKMVKPVSFEFEITQKVINPNPEWIRKQMPQQPSFVQKPFNKTVQNARNSNDNNYPEGYAYADILIDEGPPDGYYFYAPYNGWNLYPDTDPYVNIVDRYGTPVYYRKFQSEAYDLKRLPNGLLSCYSYHPYWGHIVMDSSYRFLDLVQMGNGYSYTDFHEFQMLENGHTFVMTYDAQLVDMSLVVPGGNPNAIVTGFVFQELDTQKNVVFQWRSWDHFEITETGPEIDLLAEDIDYVHGNTIEVESDTSLLISSRNFHEITRIDRNTGDIIWRLGGSQNQFDFGTDTLRFSRQHDSRRIYNGHVTAFDNGSYHPEPQFSSAVEYALDTENMTATLINRYRHDPDYYGWAMGNAFWTPDETVVIGWGTQVPAITEIDLQGNPLWEVFVEGFTYRAYRFPWKTNYFTTEKDTLNYGYIWYQDSLLKKIRIFNPQPVDIQITSTYNMTGHFKATDEFPVTISSGSYADLTIRFLPDSVGEFHDVITFNSDINSDTLVQRIAQQVNLVGYATQGQGIDDNNSWKVSVYPNPVQDILSVSLVDGNQMVQIEISDLTGKQLFNQTAPFTNLERINMSAFKAGVYLVRVTSLITGQSRNFKLIKDR